MRKRSLFPLLALTSAWLAACEIDNPTDLDAPVGESLGNGADHASAKARIDRGRRYTRGKDEELFEVGAENPEFGGYYFENGHAVVWTTDLSPEVRGRIVASLKRHAVPTRIGTGSADIEFRQGRFSWTDIEYWRSIVMRHLTTNSVWALDADDAGNRLTVGAAPTADTTVIRGTLLAAGIPSEAIRIGFVGDPQNEGCIGCEVNDSIADPGPGFMIHNQFAPLSTCTIGPFYESYETWAGPYFLTADHCTLTKATGTLDTVNITQAGPNQGVISTGEVWVEPRFPAGESPSYAECPIEYSAGCKFVDVALHKYVPQRFENTWEVAITDSDLDVTSYDLQNGLMDAQLSAPIKKTGAVTGTTSGSVQWRCIERYVQNENIWYMCLDLADYWSEGGDSGAPVFYEYPWPSGGTATAASIVGVHKGRTTFLGTDYAMYSRADLLGDAMSEDGWETMHSFCYLYNCTF